MTQNNLQVTKNRKELSISSDRATKTHQLTLTDYFNISQNFNTLTTGQICKFLEIPDSDLKKCRVGGFLELDSYVILHKGRNLWRLLEIWFFQKN